MDTVEFSAARSMVGSIQPGLKWIYLNNISGRGVWLLGLVRNWISRVLNLSEPYEIVVDLQRHFWNFGADDKMNWKNESMNQTIILWMNEWNDRTKKQTKKPSIDCRTYFYQRRMIQKNSLAPYDSFYISFYWSDRYTNATNFNFNIDSAHSDCIQIQAIISCFSKTNVSLLF